MSRQLTVAYDGIVVNDPHATVHAFEGTDDDGRRWAFGIEHRPAAEIIAAFEAGITEVFVEVEEWQILGPATTPHYDNKEKT